MELKQLEYFMVACEKGSFNQAAECLHIPTECQQGDRDAGTGAGACVI